MKLRNVILLILAVATNIVYANQWILITGGSGYIGSVTSLYLAQKNYKVIILDNKSPQSEYLSKANYLDLATEQTIVTNKAETFPLHNIFFVQGDYADKNLLDKIFTNYNIYGVIHFAGFIEVQNSVKNPSTFYDNNLAKSIKLLNRMLSHNVNKFIFSSSAAVYGNAQEIPIKEDSLKLPINPYGRTKYMLENVLEDFSNAYDLQGIALRYFNAAGAVPKYDLGERHENETHLIPILLDCIYNDKEFKVFGDTYQTKDGTCIRDYIHVLDLARAHYLALKYLESNNDIKFDSFNLGSGIGYSVKEIIEIAKKMINKDLKCSIVGKREGDPDILTCKIEKAKALLHWYPKHSAIQKLISDANTFYIQNYFH